MLKRLMIFLPFVLLLCIGTVYCLTKPPAILWIDSGTMIAASRVLGIPNPPGFPLYMLLSHPFSLMPFFSVITSMELFTILCSLLTLFVVYHIVLHLLKTYFLTENASSPFAQLVPISAACFTIVCLAFSYEYWSQSENTEAFLLTDCLFALFVFFSLQLLTYSNHSEKKQLFRLLLLLAGVFGLATGANPTIAVFLPLYGYLLFMFRKDLSQKKIVILCLSFLGAMCAIYSYLPLRAARYPFVNWGNPHTFPLLLDQLRGKGLNIYEPQTNTINGFTGSPFVFFQSLLYALWLLLLQFTPLLLPLFVVGVVALWKKSRQVFFALFLPVLANLLYVGLYFSGNQEAWLIPLWVIAAIVIGLGVFVSLQRVTKTRIQKSVLISFCLLPLLFWVSVLNRSHQYYTRDYGYNLYAPLAKNAIILGSGDFFNSLTYYLRVGDVYRPDITPITVNTFYVNNWYRDDIRHTTSVFVSPEIEHIIQYKHFDEYNRAMNMLIADNIAKHPIYVTPLALTSSALVGTSAGELQLDNRFALVPHGLTMQVIPTGGMRTPVLSSYHFQLHSPLSPIPFYLERNYTGAFINIQDDYVFAYQSLAEWYATHGNTSAAILWYKKALAISPTNLNLLASMGNFFFEHKEYASAVSLYQSVLALSTNSIPEVSYNLAISQIQLEETQDAVQNLQTVVHETDPTSDLFAHAQSTLSQLIPPTRTNHGASLTHDQQNALSFLLPQGFSYTPGAIDTIQNAQLTIFLHGQRIQDNQSVASLLSSSPLQPSSGILLTTRPYTVVGFQAQLQVFGLPNGKTLLSFVLTTRKAVYQITVTPGDSPAMKTFYAFLTSLKPEEGQ